MLKGMKWAKVLTIGFLDSSMWRLPDVDAFSLVFLSWSLLRWLIWILLLYCCCHYFSVSPISSETNGYVFEVLSGCEPLCLFFDAVYVMNVNLSIIFFKPFVIRSCRHSTLTWRLGEWWNFQVLSQSSTLCWKVQCIHCETHLFFAYTLSSE